MKKLLTFILILFMLALSIVYFSPKIFAAENEPDTSETIPTEIEDEGVSISEAIVDGIQKILDADITRRIIELIMTVAWIITYIKGKRSGLTKDLALAAADNKTNKYKKYFKLYKEQAKVAIDTNKGIIEQMGSMLAALKVMCDSSSLEYSAKDKVNTILNQAINTTSALKTLDLTMFDEIDKEIESDDTEFDDEDQAEDVASVVL